MALTETELIQYLIENHDLMEDEATADAKLFSTGLVDSFGLVDLIEFIEQQSGIEVDAADVTLDNFDSVERMLAYVQQRSAG